MLPRIPLAILLFIAICTLYNLHSISSKDPTSPFFNPRLGYAPAYSSLRAEQAESFIATAIENGTARNNSEVAPSDAQKKKKKKLCVGIPSIARKGAGYLRTAVGSLLDGLTAQERDEIHFVVFIPHSDPTVHAAYSEEWLSDLVDDVLVYDVDEAQMQHIKAMEAEAGLFREKGLYDYSYLLKACYKQGAPYIAMFEDDIVAMDGWYHRSMAAVETAETLSALRKAEPEFLYLRLFYTEEFLGWNSEEWKTYFFYSAVFAAMPALLLTALRFASSSAKRVITDRAVFLSVPVSVAFIIAFFALGRATVLPLPAGVNEMPNYGCCSQGFVFPRAKAMELVRWFEEKKLGFVDVLTEEYADQRGELRWAITPSVIQHVGRKSSKVDDYGPESKYGLSVAEKIWNFGFEKYRAEELRREHWRVGEERRKEG